MENKKFKRNKSLKHLDLDMHVFSLFIILNSYSNSFKTIYLNEARNY